MICWDLGQQMLQAIHPLSPNNSQHSWCERGMDLVGGDGGDGSVFRRANKHEGYV